MKKTFVNKAKTLFYNLKDHHKGKDSCKSNTAIGESLGLRAVNNRLLTASEVAKVLCVSERTVYNMAKNGEIKPCHVMGSIRFHPDVVDDYIFFSNSANSLVNIRLSDKEKLIKRFDERNEQAKAYLESFFKKRSKKKEVKA